MMDEESSEDALEASLAACDGGDAGTVFEARVGRRKQWRRRKQRNASRRLETGPKAVAKIRMRLA